jgi:hypothetical protein
MTTGQFSGYALAGNNYDPDVMAWVLANGVKDTWYPSGRVFRFNGTREHAQHIDAHVWCSPLGAAFQLFETIYYTAPSAADVVAASKRQ